MAEPMSPPPASESWAARILLRSARVGTLATSEGGAPYAALATPACLPDGSVALLLSDLSEHTRQLTADPRCALMVMGAAAEANPQTAPRLTLLGTAARDGDPELRRRYLAVHPYAALYAGFADFAIWRLTPLRGHFIGGFARAGWLDRAALAPDPAALAALLEAEPGIIAHCNDDHADALARIAVGAGAGEGDWRMVVADTEGCDLAAGEKTIRIPWQSPVRTGGDVRSELVRLSRANS